MLQQERLLLLEFFAWHGLESTLNRGQVDRGSVGQPMQVHRQIAFPGVSPNFLERQFHIDNVLFKRFGRTAADGEAGGGGTAAGERARYPCTCHTVYSLVLW